ncbi:hypothetical protein [Dubosiella muris]|uniref:Uncharacterized protein n=1 Tax=Dubosiella muris TaxID=3038133 RepID=A0AC61R486_9FIRM|nr:hypothetical protein [Dubosiella muris]TGY64240.1 hypothetical protein E5336_12200 [Dubosiella muris]
MKKIKTFLSRPVVIGLLFVMAIGLLLSSGVSGTRAALTYFSDTYQTQMQVNKIGVTLMENGHPVAFRNYEADGQWSEDSKPLLEKMGAFKIGQTYPEALQVKNSGTIDTFVRVTLLKYWTDPEGNKLQYHDDGQKERLTPEWIELHFAGNGWVEDKSAQTLERSVYYYTDLLEVEETSAPLTDTFKISPKVASKVDYEVTVEGDTTTTKTVYSYNDLKFHVEAKVDAVQQHNAPEAIQSAWGKHVSVQGDTLSLN